MLKKEKEITNKIEDLIESDDLEDIMKVRTLKEEAQQMEDERQENTSRNFFAFKINQNSKRERFLEI